MLAITVKQALVVALDSAVQVGRRRVTFKPDETTGHPRRRVIRLTLNRVFDALAARWSNHFRLAQEEGRAFHVRDMRPETARASWRDLIRNGIRLEKLWDIVVGEWSAKKTGRNPLYHVTRLRPSKKGRRRNQVGGYVVHVRHGSAELERFEQLIRADPHYKLRPSGWRLLLANEPTPARKPHHSIVVERPYNVVGLGTRSERLLAILERSRLLFNVRAFQEEYRQLAEDADARLQFRSIDQRLRSLSDEDLPYWDEWVPIKTGFYRLLNRRYQPTHFWPLVVSTKLDPPRQIKNVVEETSQRSRWFASADLNQELSDPPLAIWSLTGFDVSSSQTQILAVLLGLDELERHATSGGPPFKQYLAERAWDVPALRGAYSGPDDKRLIELVKNLWMRVSRSRSPSACPD